MRNSNRDFGSYQKRSRNNNNQSRNFSRGFGNRGRGGAMRKQPTFDPTPLILRESLNQDRVEVVEKEYQPSHQFADFAISDQLKRNIGSHNYTTPTPIQDQIIPHILERKDVVGIANTGTGKTAAFLIPLLQKITESHQEKVLIIAPTRELALQINDELKAFSQGMNIYSAVCIGGSNMNSQINALRRRPQFVIGTPGRIKDLSQRGILKFEQFTSIVLDEVDRMLDMGFVHDMRMIINSLPRNRHSLFFSATMNGQVRQIMEGFLNNPVTVKIESTETSSNVKQEIVKIKGRSKVDILHELLLLAEYKKVLVFGRTKHGAEQLSRALQERGFSVSAIHGNKSQGKRQRTIRQFKENRIQALIATDVVSRGLDIDNITHVINYDLPGTYDDYIHRIGRTGRANKQGIALTFVG